MKRIIVTLVLLVGLLSTSGTVGATPLIDGLNDGPSVNVTYVGCPDWMNACMGVYEYNETKDWVIAEEDKVVVLYKDGDESQFVGGFSMTKPYANSTTGCYQLFQPSGWLSEWYRVSTGCFDEDGISIGGLA